MSYFAVFSNCSCLVISFAKYKLELSFLYDRYLAALVNIGTADLEIPRKSEYLIKHVAPELHQKVQSIIRKENPSRYNLFYLNRRLKYKRDDDPRVNPSKYFDELYSKDVEASAAMRNSDPIFRT